MKKLCENGHVCIDGDHEICPCCGGAFIYQTEDGAFVEVGVQNVIKEAVAGIKRPYPIGLFVPDGIVHIRGMVISDSIICDNFIGLYRHFYMGGYKIEEFPQAMFNVKKKAGSLRIELCSEEFWNVMKRLIPAVGSKFEDPNAVSDAVIMSELETLLNNDWNN